MTPSDKPVEATLVSCEVCLREIPKSEATAPEAVDYFVYFCGPDCFEKWTDHRRPSEEDVAGAQEAGATLGERHSQPLEHAMNAIEQQAMTLALGTHDSGSAPDFSERRRAFRLLHDTGCFVIPNPWDVGSARYLQHLGFPALATTSAGFAFSQGLPDSEHALSRDRNLTHIAEITAAVDVPVNADFAAGYGKEPQDVADSVRRCIATGVAGLSIEDATGDPSLPLYELSLALERVRGARQAIDESRADVLLTARAECYLVGHPHPLQESVRRLQAYAEAGADVLFAPGVHEPADIKAIVEALRPKPFNLLVVRDSGLNVADIAALGVRRISVGPALALAAWTGFRRAAQMLKVEGRFAGFANLVPYNDINGFFTADSGARSGG